MAGKVIVDQIQIGNNATSTNNFVLQTFNDGTAKLQRGNIGGTLADILSIAASGQVTPAWEKAAGNQSLSASGYQKLGNGLILQWGTSVTNASADNVVTFPSAFPTAVLNIVVGAYLSGSGGFAGWNTATTSQFNMNGWTANASRSAITTYWFAIGY